MTRARNKNFLLTAGIAKVAMWTIASLAIPADFENLTACIMIEFLALITQSKAIAHATTYSTMMPIA